MKYQELVHLDSQDEILPFRECFHIPKYKGKKVIYFCGNSLGLQPKTTHSFIKKELKKWKKWGVKGHFETQEPWVSYHHLTKKTLSHLVGAKPSEVLAVGSLTTNLHLLLASFYLPKGKRVKILVESAVFPSDYYALYSHMQMKGVNPQDHLVTLNPQNGNVLSTAEIVAKINELGDTLALVLLPSVQYYTGQVFDMETIAKFTHKQGGIIGLDLAHGIGNIPLQLHNWKIDFAVWCSYKYLNSGPGGIGGMYVHKNHGFDTSRTKLSGWWGHNEKERFAMSNQLNPIRGIDGWNLSNTNIISMSTHRAALRIFDTISFDKLRVKSLKMTEWLIQNLAQYQDKIAIITPLNEKERGCQLSLYCKGNTGRNVFRHLTENAVVCDWREPNVIRIAPTPLYNTFRELGQFLTILKNALKKK